MINEKEDMKDSSMMSDSSSEMKDDMRDEMKIQRFRMKDEKSGSSDKEIRQGMKEGEVI